jgi:hypothetical protein
MGPLLVYLTWIFSAGVSIIEGVVAAFPIQRLPRWRMPEYLKNRRVCTFLTYHHSETAAYLEEEGGEEKNLKRTYSSMLMGPLHSTLCEKLSLWLCTSCAVKAALTLFLLLQCYYLLPEIKTVMLSH